MSLYGNVKKVGSAAFQFDRRYHSRYQMDNQAQNDGVYIGRYVLVEYGPRFGKDANNIIEMHEGSAMAGQETLEFVYQSLPEGTTYDPDQVYYTYNSNTESYQIYEYDQHRWDAQLNANSIFKKVQKLTYQLINTKDGSVRVDGIIENTDYRNNADEDLRYYGATYDSTVWQKVFIDGQDKYVMIAELNALAPKLDITQDTPISYKVQEAVMPNYRTNGIVSGRFNEHGELVETVRLTNVKEVENVPHFDTALDTELTYLLHIPTTLKLELNNNTVDFNENGFNMAYSYPESEGVSTIAWIPKGHDENGNEFYLDNYDIIPQGGVDNAGSPFAELRGGPNYQIDTKMLFMSFPALGNAMNAVYNLIYGKPDPLDDLEHGAMRPYFKRYLSRLTLTNYATVRDQEGSSYFIKYKLRNEDNEITPEQYFTITGKIGESVTASIDNYYDVSRMVDLSPEGLVEVRFYDKTTSKIFPSNYYKLTSDDYNSLPKNDGEPAVDGQFVLWDTLRNQPIEMSIHAPTGDEDPDMKWLQQVPQLADILANADSGLATVLSSIFGTVDPLTGTSKYFLFNDWSMDAENSGSGPAIINKPAIIGGYHQDFITVFNDMGNKNVLGEKTSESPGYMVDFANSTANTMVKIPYPHSEIVTSEAFSRGDFKIDFNTWQLVNYKIPDIPLVIKKLATAPSGVNHNPSQQNQDLISVTTKNTKVTFSSSAQLNSFSENGSTGQWVSFDIDTGFKSIIGMKVNNTKLKDTDENSYLSKGLQKGHILISIKADEYRTDPYVLKIQASGFNIAEYSIQYLGVR